MAKENTCKKARRVGGKRLRTRGKTLTTDALNFHRESSRMSKEHRGLRKAIWGSLKPPFEYGRFGSVR